MSSEQETKMVDALAAKGIGGFTLFEDGVWRFPLASDLDFPEGYYRKTTNRWMTIQEGYKRLVLDEDNKEHPKRSPPDWAW